MMTARTGSKLTGPLSRLPSPRRSVLSSLVIAAFAAGTCGQSTPKPHTTWSERVQVAAGEGHRGPWRMNASDYRWVDDPSVDIDKNGDALVAWVDQSRKDIFFQRYGKDGKPRFVEPTDVSRSRDTFSWLPRVVASDDSQRVYILWQEIVFTGGTHGGEIFFARSTDGGRTFGAPASLTSNSKEGDGKGRLDADNWDNGSLDLARGMNGHLYVAWTEYEGSLWFRRSIDGGQSFSPPRRIGGSKAEPARAPSIAAGPASSVHIAWSVGEKEPAALRFASSFDSGQSFGGTRTVSEGDMHADAPRLVVDRNGTIHLVYAASELDPQRAFHIRYTRLKSGARRFEPSRRIPQNGDVESAHYPEIRVDGSRGIYLLWEQYPKAGGRPQGLGFTYTSDGGESFGASSPIPGIAFPAATGFNGSQQGLLMSKLAVNASGDIAVVNSTFRPEQDSHVWLLRGRRP